MEYLIWAIIGVCIGSILTPFIENIISDFGLLVKSIFRIKDKEQY